MARKRGQNEGSIYRRKDGLWSAQVSGEGKRVSKYFKSRREAQHWLDEIRSQVKNGLSLSGAQATMSEFLDHWLETAKTNLRPNTHMQYGQIIHGHILPLLGKVRMKDLRPDMIQTIYNQKLAEGASGRTVQMIHAVLHHALDQAVKWELLGRNPADAVVRPKARRSEMKVLDDVQVRTLLMTTKGSRFEALFQVAVTTGMRQGELFGLKWTDILWSMGLMNVQRQVQRVPKQGWSFMEPKTRAGRRMVPIGAGAIEALRRQKERQAVEKALAGKRWQEHGLVFTTAVGTPMDAHNVRKDYLAVLREAGLPEVRFHDLRHSAASLMLNHGIPVLVVSKILGHANPAITLNTYGHLYTESVGIAAQLMDELVTPLRVEFASEKTEAQRIAKQQI